VTIKEITDGLVERIVTATLNGMMSFFLYIVLYPTALIFNGYVTYKLWAWLLIPSAAHVGASIPPITWGVGTALCVFCSWMFTGMHLSDAKKGELDGGKVLWNIVSPYVRAILTLIGANFVSLLVF